MVYEMWSLSYEVNRAKERNDKRKRQVIGINEKCKSIEIY